MIRASHHGAYESGGSRQRIRRPRGREVEQAAEECRAGARLHSHLAFSHGRQAVFALHHRTPRPTADTAHIATAAIQGSMPSSNRAIRQGWGHVAARGRSRAGRAGSRRSWHRSQSPDGDHRRDQHALPAKHCAGGQRRLGRCRPALDHAAGTAHTRVHDALNGLAASTRVRLQTAAARRAEK